MGLRSSGESERLERWREQVRKEALALDARIFGAAYLRRLRGEPEPLRKKKTPKLAEPVRIQRRSGLWEDGRLIFYRGGKGDSYPTGAEWFFARWCALECLHLWEAPEIVRQYLETGDPHLANTTDEENEQHRREVRDTAYGAALEWRQPGAAFDPAPVNANLAAQYACSGQIDGAAEHAIRALAWAAREAALRADPALSVAALLAAQAAARQSLEDLFREKAEEIYRGEETL